jgi:aerobic carbon-monoxide dehydrogenase medium subunit
MLPPFKVLNPISAAEAVKELARIGEQAKIYGGGTELLVLLRHNLVQTDYLLNIKAIPELGKLHYQDGILCIGASVTHRRLETDRTVREMLPMLALAESQVANIRVRSQGTIGGNLCFNDPHSDPATALLIYDAKVRILGPQGVRQIPLQEFLLGMYTTALKPDELLLSIEVPSLPPRYGSSYMRIHRLQRPTLGVAVAAARENGAFEDVRIAVGCVGPNALRLTELEEKIRAGDPNDSARIIAETKPYLKKILAPIDDLLGSAEYKIYITGVLLERALRQAQQSVHGRQDQDNG